MYLFEEKGIVRILRIYAVVWYHGRTELASHRVARQSEHLYINVGAHSTVR